MKLKGTAVKTRTWPKKLARPENPMPKKPTKPPTAQTDNGLEATEGQSDNGGREALHDEVYKTRHRAHRKGPSFSGPAASNLQQNRGCILFWWALLCLAGRSVVEHDMTNEE
jgi:hypothetical protein